MKEEQVLRTAANRARAGHRYRGKKGDKGRPVIDADSNCSKDKAFGKRTEIEGAWYLKTDLVRRAARR